MSFTEVRWKLFATTFALICGTISASVANAQLPFQESFEAEPGTGYTLSGAFDDEGFDYFNRFAVPEPEGDNAARDDFQNGWDGSYGIQGQDHNSDDGPATLTVDIAGIDISSSSVGSTLDLSIALTSTDSFEPLAMDNVRVAASDSGLTATIAFGALASEFAERPFDNYEAVDGDGIVILAAIDGGNQIEIGRFSPPAEGAVMMGPAGDLYLDMDGDGVGTGDRLTADLTDYAFPIPPVPEPSSLFLGVMALLGLTTIRQRR